MGAKAKQGAGGDSNDEALAGKPTFPYTNKPGSLRKFLEGIPKRPKPPKVNKPYLTALGFKDANDYSVIRVLKAVGLLGDGNDPTASYVEFMKPGTGPATLGSAVKSTYAKIFEHSHEPHKEPEATLRNYFHIHSGGGDSTITYQIQTFKALCDFADFRDGSSVVKPMDPKGASGDVSHSAGAVSVGPSTAGAIHIDLHIHLPENKSRRDYEYMFEDIARYLFGRDLPPNGRNEA